MLQRPQDPRASDGRDRRVEARNPSVAWSSTAANPSMSSFEFLGGVLLGMGALLPACSHPEPDLVVYCSLDQVFSEQLIDRFAGETGLEVRAEFDTEASKTVGLVRRLIEESSSPRCDVFWNNEIAQTVRLAERDLLAAYDSPSAADIPERFRDPERRWTGFAARARVLIVNTERAHPGEVRGMQDLLDPRWTGQAAIARPLTGTTLTHAAALYQVLGEQPAREWLERVAAASLSGDVNLVNSNGQVMTRVASGDLAWGWTDTDDFNVARQRGAPVAAVLPDQESHGTLLIPNTISIQKGAPHMEAARRFVDWVLSKEIERELAFSDSAQIPVRDGVDRPEHVARLGDFRSMEIDWFALGRSLEQRTSELKDMFLK